MEVDKAQFIAWQAARLRGELLPVVKIRDGSCVTLDEAYRCLYCGEWFDYDGAREHFGALDAVARNAQCSREAHRIEVAETIAERIRAASKRERGRS
jgi:hypothetical protein